MTEITFNVSKTGEVSYQPAEDNMGHEGEHNAARLTVRADSEFCSGATYFRLHFPNYVSHELYPDQTGTFTYSLPQSLTRAGNLLFQVVGYGIRGTDVELIAKSDMVTLPILGSLDPPEQVCPQAVDCLDELVASSKAAAEAAETARDAAGGYVIRSTSINSRGELVLTYANGTTVNAGVVKGEKGDKGDPSPYILPTAANNTLGGIKVGNGLEITEGGVLSPTHKVISSSYTVNLAPWTRQPLLTAGSAAALKTWEEEFYYVYFTSTPGVFKLCTEKNDLSTVVTDANGQELLFDLQNQDFSLGGNTYLLDGEAVDFTALSPVPVIRFAATPNILHNIRSKDLFGKSPDRIEIIINARVLGNKMNNVDIISPNSIRHNTREVMFDKDNNYLYSYAKNNNISIATLLLFDTLGFTKKHRLVTARFNIDFCGSTWHATSTAMAREFDDHRRDLAVADSRAHSRCFEYKYTGHLSGADYDINRDIHAVNYSSSSSVSTILNGSQITIKEYVL